MTGNVSTASGETQQAALCSVVPVNEVHRGKDTEPGHAKFLILWGEMRLAEAQKGLSKSFKDDNPSILSNTWFHGS